MNIDTKASNFALTPPLRLHVEHRVRKALGRLSAHLKHVVVRLSDLNGPRGGVDKRCQMLLSLNGLPAICIHHAEADLYAAVDVAADRARHTLARQLQRSRRAIRRSAPPWES